jgi:hypothetical protein
VIRRLFAFLLVLALLLAGLDFAAKAWVESKVESAAKKELPPAVAVDATIDSFPILERLAVTGKVKKFSFDMAGIASKPVAVSFLHLELHDIRFDRSSLWSHPKVTGVGFIDLSATVSEDAIRTLTKADVRLFRTGATLKVGTNTVTARAELQKDGIHLTVAPATEVVIPLPSLDIVPCSVRFHFVNGGVIFTCQTTKVPRIFAEALGNAAVQDLSN